ncbi:MAG: hypothetical protein SNH79_01955 [Rikenellaceae bacterium]
MKKMIFRSKSWSRAAAALIAIAANLALSQSYAAEQDAAVDLAAAAEDFAARIEEVAAEEVAEEISAEEIAVTEAEEVAQESKALEVKVMSSNLSNAAEFDYRDFTSPIGYFVAHNRDSVTLESFAEKPRRVDRGINRKKFIFSGEKTLGISFAHIGLNSSNSDFLLMLTDVSASGSINSVKPSFSYFYRDNRALGVRFTYSNLKAELESSAIDLGESNGIYFDIPYFYVDRNNYEYSLFHRAYAALGNSGKVGLFAEIELAASHGVSNFGYKDAEEDYRAIKSKSTALNLNFNPGITAFIFHNVSAYVSFGLGGLSYSHVEQFNEEGVYIGERVASKFNFSLNLLAINFGISMHLWKQKELKFKE